MKKALFEIYFDTQKYLNFLSLVSAYHLYLKAGETTSKKSMYIEMKLKEIDTFHHLIIFMYHLMKNYVFYVLMNSFYAFSDEKLNF